MEKDCMINSYFPFYLIPQMCFHNPYATHFHFLISSLWIYYRVEFCYWAFEFFINVTHKKTWMVKFSFSSCVFKQLTPLMIVIMVIFYATSLLWEKEVHSNLLVLCLSWKQGGLRRILVIPHPRTGFSDSQGILEILLY